LPLIGQTPVRRNRWAGAFLSLVSLVFISGSVAQLSHGALLRGQTYGALALDFGWLAYESRHSTRTIRSFVGPVVLATIGLSFLAGGVAPADRTWRPDRPLLLAIGTFAILVGVALAALIRRLTAPDRKLHPDIAATVTALPPTRRGAASRIGTVVLRDGRRIENVSVFAGGYTGMPRHAVRFDARDVVKIERGAPSLG